MEKATRIDIKKLIKILEEISKGSIYCNVTVNQEENDMLVEGVITPAPPMGNLTLEDLEDLEDSI